jgi:hypothetical protein
LQTHKYFAENPQPSTLNPKQDHPLNGDIHEVVPNKFIAFVGPAGVEEAHNEGYKTFAADFYANIFSEVGSTAFRF